MRIYKRNLSPLAFPSGVFAYIAAGNDKNLWCISKMMTAAGFYWWPLFHVNRCIFDMNHRRVNSRVGGVIGGSQWRKPAKDWGVSRSAGFVIIIRILAQ